MLPRRSLLALPLLAGCAGMQPPDTPAGRFAAALEQASASSAAAVGRVDAFETLARRETAAIAFANAGHRGLPPVVGPPEAGIAGAAGQVITPAFAALGDYAHALAEIAAGQPVVPRAAEAAGPLLAAQATQGLAQARQAGVAVPAATQQGGLAGIAALAGLPHRLAAGPRPGLAAVVAEAEPQVAAVATMLQALIEPTPGGGVRGVLRGQREALDRDAARFLATAARDPRLGPADRYGLYRGVTALREDDPAPGTVAAIGAVVESMARAHAALAGPAPAAAAQVAEFEAAVGRLGLLTEGSRRREPAAAR